MTNRIRMLLLLTLCGTSLSWASAARKPKASEPDTAKKESTPMRPRKPDAVENEYLIAFKDQAAVDGRATLFAKHKAVEKEKVGSGHLYLIEVEGDSDVIIKALEAEAGVRYVEPNLKMRIQPLPSHDKKINK